jgi:hypothetical protein
MHPTSEIGEVMTIEDEICAEGDFRIAADGTWFHNGAPIRRARMVRLFATVLRREADGGYWLITPGEKVPVVVEDAPFLAVDLEIQGRGVDQMLIFGINTGGQVRADAGHPFVVRGTPDAPRPYLGLGDSLEALVARSVYYALAEVTVEGPGAVHGVWSAGLFFPFVPGLFVPDASLPDGNAAP